jgi:hypothetical protein
MGHRWVRKGVDYIGKKGSDNFEFIGLPTVSITSRQNVLDITEFVAAASPS